MNTSSTISEIFFEQIEPVFAETPHGSYMGNRMFKVVPTGGKLAYSDITMKKMDTSLGAERVYLVDHHDACDIQRANLDLMYPNLTVYMTHFPHKKIYLRAFCSVAVNRDENRRVFSVEVLEIIPLLLKQHGSLPQPEKLKEYESKWKVVMGYHTIGMEELNAALEDFDINKSLLTIVYDICYTFSAANEFPKNLGETTIRMYSPDKMPVCSVSQALFTVFRLATLFDWDNLKTTDPTKSASLRALIMSQMVMIASQGEHSYLLKEEMLRALVLLQDISGRYNMIDSPHYIFHRVDFNDVMVFDGFMDLVEKYKLSNYQEVELDKERCKKGVIPMWKVLILLLRDWIGMFFGNKYPVIKILVIHAIQHLVPVWKLKSDEHFMQIVLNLCPESKDRIQKITDDCAPRIDNFGNPEFTVKHELNEFQIKRCRKWVHRDIVNSRMAQGKSFNSDEVQELLVKAEQDLSAHTEKNKVVDAEKTELGMNLLSRLMKKVMVYGDESKPVAPLEPKNDITKVIPKAVLKSMKSAFSDQSKTDKCSMWEEEKKEMQAKILNLEKTVKQMEKQSERQEMKLKDKMEKEWKRKMEAKEKKWTEEKKALKEKLAAKERKVVEIKMALDSEVLKNQELQKKNQEMERELKDQVQAETSPPNVKISAQVKIRLDQLQSSRSKLLGENHAANATKKIFELKSLTKDPKIKQGAELEQLKFNIAHEKYLKAVDESIQLIRKTPGILLNEIPALPPFPALCEGFERAYARAMEQRDMERAGPSTSSSSASSRTSEDCAICLEEMEETEHLHKCENCNRNFHAICVSDWLFKKSTCPMCRRHMVDPEEFPELQ